VFGMSFHVARKTLRSICPVSVGIKKIEFHRFYLLLRGLCQLFTVIDADVFLRGVNGSQYADGSQDARLLQHNQACRAPKFGQYTRLAPSTLVETLRAHEYLRYALQQ